MEDDLPRSREAGGVKTCVCGTSLGLKNKSGLCRSCIAKRHNADPEMQARRKAAIQERFKDPAVRAAYARRIGEHVANMSDEERAARREHGRWMYRNYLSQPDVVAKTSSKDARRRAGISRSDTVLAWCPPAYREQYRALKASGAVKAAEAKVMILDQIKADERARLAAMTPFERQMEAVARGARIVAKPDLRKAAHDFTLGGVSGGML